MSDTSYPVYQHYGTNAQRLAFTPSPPASGQPIYVWYETDTDKVFLYTTGWHQIASSSSGSAISALTGDVTATGPGSVAATIANSAVTLAKIANASANSKLLGSGASGSGAPYSEITLGSGLSMSGTTLSATAATPAMVKIDEQTPTGTNVSFASLGSYTHLVLRYMARGDTAATTVNLLMTFNGDTGANYDRERGTAAGTVNTANEQLAQTSIVVGTIAAASATASRPGVGTIDLYDYRGTSFNKVGNASNGYVYGTATTNMVTQFASFCWRNTAAITSITITLAAGNFVSGSKFSLYGVT